MLSAFRFWPSCEFGVSRRRQSGGNALVGTGQKPNSACNEAGVRSANSGGLNYSVAICKSGAARQTKNLTFEIRCALFCEGVKPNNSNYGMLSHHPEQKHK